MSEKAKFRVVILDSEEQDLKELKAYVIKNFSIKASDRMNDYNRWESKNI